MRYRPLLAALAVALAFGAAACGGGGDSNSSSSGGNEDVKGSLSMMAIWAGEEQTSFQAVIDGFKKQYPNVDVKYTSGGRQPGASALHRGSGRQAAGHRGPRPARARSRLREEGRDQADRRSEEPDRGRPSADDVAKAGQVDGKQYAVMFKGANKSTIWYNVADFKEAGVEPPKTWPRPHGRSATRSRPPGSPRIRWASTSAGR